MVKCNMSGLALNFLPRDTIVRDFGAVTRLGVLHQYLSHLMSQTLKVQFRTSKIFSFDDGLHQLSANEYCPESNLLHC